MIDEDVRIPGLMPNSEIVDINPFTHRGMKYDIYIIRDEKSNLFSDGKPKTTYIWWAWARLMGEHVEIIERMRVLGFIYEGQMEPFTSYTARLQMSRLTVGQRMKEEVEKLIDWFLDEMYPENAERMEELWDLLTKAKRIEDKAKKEGQRKK